MITLRDGDRICGMKRNYSSEDGSSIFVDGRRIRLSDLESVKRDWHLEGDRFAFISQGEVSEVIQQRPLQRRTHLECIFGIDLYRRQREEACQRLDSASSEMQRIITLSSELQGRKDAIAGTVVRAREAKAIMDILERERSLLYWIRRARAEALLDDLRQERSLLEDLEASALFWASGWKRAVSEEGVRIQDLSRDRGEAMENLSSRDREISELRREMLSQSSLLHQTIERKSAFEQDIDAERARFLDIESRYQDALRENERTLDERGAAEEAFTRSRKKWDEYQESVREQSERLKAFREDLSACEAVLDASRAKGKRLGRALLDASTDLLGAEEIQRETAEKLNEAENRLVSLRGREEEAAQRHRDAYAAYQKAAVSRQHAAKGLAAAEAEIEALRESSFSRVYPPPVQHLLAAARLGRLDASPRPLAEVISCPEHLTLAMESFLGNRQFLMLVRNIEEAGRCIDNLKLRSAGRATFLPIENSRERRPASGFNSQREGVVGWAAELLGMEDEWKACVLHVIGDLLVVNDFSTGRNIVREGFKGPIVTLEGDVFNPGGSISGGKTARTPGAIEMKRIISEKERAADAIRKEQLTLDMEITGLEGAERKASERSRQFFEERKLLEDEIRVLSSEADLSFRERDRGKERISSILSDLADCGKDQVGAVRRLEELRRFSGESVDTSREVSLVKELEEQRSRAELAAERSRTAARMMAMISEERERSGKRVSSLENGLAGNVSAGSAHRSRLKELGGRYFIIWKKYREAASRLDILEKKYSSALSAQNRVVERASASSGRFESILERKRQVVQRMELAESEISESVDMWEEQFPYPGNGEVDIRDFDKVRRSVRELEKKLRETGDVDIGVLSEDAALSERLSFLQEQLRDVGSGIDELRRLIEDTDRQAGALFSTSLKEIDKRFCSLFQRLFGGGEAHLRLAEESSIWEAGVEVIARPPGKRPQHLAQLSGGEQSLSAISLLFAAMEVAGVPLAVLDEVDAALDEVNLRRFSDLAREYSHSMQLICMTHRRATMERADLMYGVTMSEPGLSQVVGVRLEDWE